MRRKRIRRRILLLSAALAVALSVLVMFSVRAFEHARHLRQRTDEPIQPWMTIPYVARSYQVPPPLLAEALGLPPGAKERRPLGQVAAGQGRAFADVKADVIQAIAQFRASRPPRGPDAPGVPPPPSPPDPSPSADNRRTP
ncbi:MAG TPA: hypothetical protein VFZ66_14935 [Herpetosiphonaceae bacterium]